LVNSLGRRLALKNPKLRKIKELTEELELLIQENPITELNKIRILEIESEISILRKKAAAVTYLDPVDLRYKNYDKKIIPKHQAVMFCIMDVSGSMGSHEKDLAKRFYLLLYLFLSYKYQKVDVVFIRHHSSATECTEEEFFYSKESGGTVVSTGFQLMEKILNERYSIEDWNIFASQASDGDNFDIDNEDLIDILTTKILPVVQYFTYLEVGNDEKPNTRGLWPHYEKLSQNFKQMDMKKVAEGSKVLGVFREFFKSETND